MCVGARASVWRALVAVDCRQAQAATAKARGKSPNGARSGGQAGQGQSGQQPGQQQKRDTPAEQNKGRKPQDRQPDQSDDDDR